MKRVIHAQLHFRSPLLAAAVLGAAFFVPSQTARAEGDYALSLDPHWSEPAPANIPTPAIADPGESILLLDAATLPSADTAAPPPQTNPLTLSFELPIWFSGMNGTVGARGFTVPANADFTQILEATDSIVGFGGRLEADYGRWIFYGSGLYMKLVKDNVGPGPVNIKFINELVIADAGILYQVGQWTLPIRGAGPYPMLTFDAGAAARYMHVGLELNPQRAKTRQANEDWADPLFAGQVYVDLDKHWRFLTRGDVGGGSSDLTWSVGMFIGYQFKFCPTVSGFAKIGYECVSEDYTNGSGADKFTWDEILHGPLISFAVEF